MKHFTRHPSKIAKSIESATSVDDKKIDRRLSSTSKRYKGYRISLDARHERYNIYDPHGELEDHGFKSVDDAMAHIDELVSIESATYNVYSSKQSGVRRKSTHRPVTSATALKTYIVEIGGWKTVEIQAQSPKQALSICKKGYLDSDDLEELKADPNYIWIHEDDDDTIHENVLAADTSDDDMDIQQMDQEYTSEKTSINVSKVPAVFKEVKHWRPGTINIDYGGGKADTAADYLAQFDVVNLVYDPYNRTPEHNKEVIRTVRKAGGADTATCSNVLNVIKEPEVRQNILQNIQKLVKPNGTVYITVYEGSGRNNEGPTKSGYQLNRKTEGYLDEIKQVFPDAVRKGKLIIAHPNGSAVTSAEDLSYDALTCEDCIYDLWTLVQDDSGAWVREDKIDTYDDYATARAEATALAKDTPCQLVEVGPDGLYVAWTSRLPDRGLPSRYWEPEDYGEDEDVESATAINAGSLVDPPQHVVDSLIQILNDHGFVLDPRFEINPGKTWIGNIHLQVIDPDSDLPQDDFEALKDFIDRNMFTEIRALGTDNDCPITWSFGVDDDGHVTGGLDINKKYVDDDQDDDIEECSVVQGADYGGAYDIEPDQFFTKEEIVEFGNAVADRVSEELEDTNSTFVLSDVYMDTPTLLHVEVTDNNMNYSADVVIDMRRIRKPRDLHKYETDAVTQIEDDYRVQNNIPLDAATRIKASENVESLQTRIFEFLDECQGYSDYNQKIEDVSDEFGMSPDEAEGYVWDWTLNQDAEWHDTADQEDVEGSSVSCASGRKHSIKTLHDALLNRASQVMRNMGFPLNEIADYLVVDIQPAEGGWLNCEVRAELSYEGMSDMIDALNPIVQKYDKDAYFDHVTGGIISAYLPGNKFNVLGSKAIEAANDYPEPSLEPSYSSEPQERTTKQEIIINIDDDLMVDASTDDVDFIGDPSFLDDDEAWTAEDEEMFKIAEPDEVYEHVMDLIIDRIPMSTGKYHVRGSVKLVYDLTLLYIDDSTGPDDQHSELDVDASESRYDPYTSEVIELDVTQQ